LHVFLVSLHVIRKIEN